MKLYQVDAFTNKLFAGNPAGVCIMPFMKDDDWMQNVARELNLSETAFLVKHDAGFDLRWFTPTCEVDLCGHATLASAHILREKGILRADENARFHTKSGILTAMKVGNMIELDFPMEQDQETAPPRDLIAGLNAEPKYVGKNRLDYIVELASEQIVRDLEPNMAILRNVETRGIIVTAAASTQGFDFVSRFFAPSVGVAEDPVTGSAHCCLGPYWKRRLDKNEFVAFQASDRGGIVYVRVNNDRVILGGEAVTVFSADLKDE